MEIEVISFAAHVDSVQLKGFIRELSPQKIILIHGEKNKMMKFKKTFQQDFKDDAGAPPLPPPSLVSRSRSALVPAAFDFQMYTPENRGEVQLEFRGEKMAKVQGEAAKREDGRIAVSGNGLFGRGATGGVLTLHRGAAHPAWVLVLDRSSR